MMAKHDGRGVDSETNFFLVYRETKIELGKHFLFQVKPTMLGYNTIKEERR